MGQLKPEQSQDNVNVTLDPAEAVLRELTDKEFPCPVCGAGLPICISKRKNPIVPATCVVCSYSYVGKKE